MKSVRWLVPTLVFLTGVAPSLAAQETTSVLLVRVRDAATARALSDAEVVMDGGRLLGVTGGDGTLRVRNLVAGQHRVSVRYIGYRTLESAVDLPSGGMAEADFDLEAVAIELDSLTVVAYRGTLAVNMAAFNERKKRGSGYFFTRDDILRTRSNTFSDLLRLVPGMQITCASFREDCSAGMTSAAPSGVTTMREGGLRGPLREGGCPIQYYVDGHYEPHGNVNDLSPADIAAVEVYVHGAQAPARYSLRKNARCGVVLVWLRQSLGG
jgi:hypothetical protein